jgi:hypothetical protein
MGLFSKIAGGLISSIAGKKAQKKMAGAYGSAAQQMPVFQQNAMRDRYAQMAQMSPEQLAQQQGEFAKRQYADTIGMLVGHTVPTRMAARGFQNELGSNFGGAAAGLAARLGSGAAGHFADAQSRALGAAHAQQAGLLGGGLRMAQGMQGARQGMMMQGAGANAAAGTMIPGALGQIGNAVYQDSIYRDAMNRSYGGSGNVGLGGARALPGTGGIRMPGSLK